VARLRVEVGARARRVARKKRGGAKEHARDDEARTRQAKIHLEKSAVCEGEL